MNRIIIIAGPTGIGKTETVVKLAEPLAGEVINADSMQIYRHMDIGTAKPTPEERARVRHHMIDIIEPDEPFNAADFVKEADPIINKLRASKKPVFVAGGTGLYIKTLVSGIFSCPQGSDKIRKRLKAEAERSGKAAMFDRLRQTDPASALRIHPNDIQRVIRALEVYELTGRPLSEHHKDHSFRSNHYKTLKIGLVMERAALYERIGKRVDLMLEHGLIEEVRGLLARGFSPDLKSMQSIGYSHVAGYLSGRLSLDEMTATLKRDTRRYAKRQFTWFGADPDMIWMEPGDINHMGELVDAFLASPG